MIINKVTTGFVVQEFDTTTRKFTKQEFVGSDDYVWEFQNGDCLMRSDDALIADEPYLPFDMVQPKD